MNEFKIYQVKDEHIREYGYASMRELLWTHHAEPVPDSDAFSLPCDIYELVYTYRTEKEPSLDWLYDLFNRNIYSRFSSLKVSTPDDFTGHSMSVSDIIETPGGQLWFCDSMGWKKVQWES